MAAAGAGVSGLIRVNPRLKHAESRGERGPWNWVSGSHAPFENLWRKALAASGDIAAGRIPATCELDASAGPAGDGGTCDFRNHRDRKSGSAQPSSRWGLRIPSFPGPGAASEISLGSLDQVVATQTPLEPKWLRALEFTLSQLGQARRGSRALEFRV